MRNSLSKGCGLLLPSAVLALWTDTGSNNAPDACHVEVPAIAVGSGPRIQDGEEPQIPEELREGLLARYQSAELRGVLARAFHHYTSGISVEREQALVALLDLSDDETIEWLLTINYGAFDLVVNHLSERVHVLQYVPAISSAMLAIAPLQTPYLRDDEFDPGVRVLRMARLLSRALGITHVEPADPTRPTINTWLREALTSSIGRSGDPATRSWLTYCLELVQAPR